ncbi:MAG: HNH endonuclease [Chloroflexota bacterium]
MFSKDDYVRALTLAGDQLKEIHYQLLRAQYAAPQRTVTAEQLAWLVGHIHYQPINRWYGELGHILADAGLAEVGEAPDHYHKDGSPAWYSFLSEGSYTPEGKGLNPFLWTMYPGLAEALEELGWVEKTESALPDEICEEATLVEGAVCRIQVNAYERNPKARRLCIEAYGTRCYLCGVDLGEVYGKVGKGYIHVHHLKPLAEIGEKYEVDPVHDLRPVCPNCHAIIHRRVPPFTIDEVQDMLRRPS